MRNKSKNYAIGVLSMAFILGLGLAPSGAAAEDNTPDKKLVQYVKDAKKSGQKQAQTQQRAIQAGWPADAVSDVVASVYDAPKIPPSQTAALVAQGSSKPDSARPDLRNVAPIPVGTKIPAYEYQIGDGDVLQIHVFHEPDASVPSVVVRPDGMISTPLTHEIQVEGLTPTQVEKAVAEKLVKQITEIQPSDVTVVVLSTVSKKIYTTGAVNRVGTIPYTYSMTVMQAISEAGGLTDCAKKKKIYVLRTQNGKQITFPFDYDEVLKGNRMELNILMLPNDTLVVP